MALLALLLLGLPTPDTAGDPPKPAEALFVFRVSLAGQSAAEARLYFCVQDSHNGYCAVISPGRAVIQKIENGHARDLASCPAASASKEVKIEIQRKAREIVVAADGRFLCRTEETTFYGRSAAASAGGGALAKLERTQSLGNISFSDDFMRTEPSADWRPLSGRWEISGVQWAERSTNPFSLFCRFPDTPSFTALDKGRTRRYVGLGIRIEHQEDHAVILFVFDKTPAWEAGLRAGDTIVEINGRPAVGLSREEILDRLKGQEGQTVAITVSREEQNRRQFLTFSVERKWVDLDSIEAVSIIQPAAFSSQALIVAGYPFWSDYSVECAVRSLGRGEVGLASCVQDADNCLLFTWSADRSPHDLGALRLIRRAGGRAQTLATRPGGFAPEQPYRLRIAVSGTHVRACVDDVPVLEATVPDVTWGQAGLYAADSLGAFFDDVRIVSSDNYSPAARSAAYKPLFVKDEFMADWAAGKGDWEVEPDNEGVICCWHRYPFPGAARLEVRNEAGPEFTLVINADRPSLSRGFRLDVNRDAKLFSLYRNAVPLAKDLPLPPEPKQIAIESQGNGVRALVNGAVVKAAATEPLQGGLAGVMGIGVPSPSRVSVSASNVLDYSFDEAPVDWRIQGGQWGIMNRWVCDPRWSWFGGRSRGIASVWHKQSFQGDVTVDAYIALAMPTYWKSPHERPGDLCLSICAESDSPASGYSVIFAGGENRWTRLYRREAVVDETRSPLFLLPRREVSWDAAMRLHKTWRHFRLAKRGGYVTFYHDGALALEYLDPKPLTQGRIGLWTVNNTLLLSRVRIAFERAAPPGLVVNDAWPFKDDQFTNLVEDEVTANVSVPTPEPRTYCVTNALPGGRFALALLADAVDAAKGRILSFDYKADPACKVDVCLDLDNAPHRIRLTGPTAEDGLSETLGEFPGLADGKWHTASFRLYDRLKDLFPCRDSFAVRNIVFANISNEGYLLAGYGGNPKGASYAVRKFRFHDGTEGDRRPPTAAKALLPFEDASRPNSIVVTVSDDSSGVDESSLRVVANGKTLAFPHPALTFHRMAGELEVNLPLAGIALKGGDLLDFQLIGLKDRAGNAAPQPFMATWRFDPKRDKFPPANIRIHAGIEDLIRYDFEQDLGDCYPVGAQRHTIPGRAGGWLRREPSGDPARGGCLRIQNLRMAHDFGVGFLTRPADVGRFPMLTFDYNIARDVPVDMSIEVNGERKVVRFSADAFRQDLRFYGDFETVGTIPRVIADSSWHSASADLFAILQKQDPTRTQFSLRNIQFGDDATGYLGNYEGAKFFLDNIRLQPILSRAALKPTWTAEDLSGIADYRIAVNTDDDFTPEGKTLEKDLTQLRDGVAYVHLMLKDGAGNWSEPVHERVFLDVTPPRVLGFDPLKDMAGTFLIRFFEKGGLDPKSVAVSVAGKRYEVDNKVLWYDQRAQTLTWRVGERVQEVLGSRLSVEVELLSASDFAGNKIASAQKWTWSLLPPARKG